MRLSGHIFTLFLINIFIKLLNGALQDNLSVRHDRHLPALFQFFRGLRSGESIQPYYFLPSILVFPSINQQHNTIIQESTGQENYQEISKSLLVKKFAKLVSNSNSIDINETVDFNRKVHVKNTSIENYTNNESKLTQSDTVTERVTTKLTTVTDENANTETTTEAFGIYPSAKNNNTFINSLSITTDINEEYGNYTDIYSYKEDSDMKKSLLDSKNTQIIEKNLLPPLEKPLLIKFKPNVSENNLLNNNRWQHFSTHKKDTLVVKGFRPLAGLYYDGFLHKPITRKNGFNPI